MTSVRNKNLTRRLELIWVIFTLLVIFIGKIHVDLDYPDFLVNSISSIMITTSGLILAIIHWQVWLENNEEKEEKLLLISFTGLLFLIDQSVNVYSDYLASIFAIIIATILFYLIWYDRTTSKKYEVVARMSYFIILGISLFSLFNLLSNILTKFIVFEIFFKKDLYLIAPHTNGILLGVLFAWMNYKYIFYRERNWNGSFVKIFGYLIIILLLAYINFLLNDNRLNIYSKSFFTKYFYSIIYTTLWVTSAILYIFNHSKKKVCFMVICLLLPFLSSIASHLLVYTPAFSTEYFLHFIQRFLVVSLPTYFFLSLSLFNYHKMIRYSSFLIFNQKFKTSTDDK